MADAGKRQASAPNGALVPTGAIVVRDGVKVAFVASGDPMAVQQRTLKLGRALANGQQVLGGVSAGETVVLDPPQTLVDGAKVKVAPARDANSDSE